MSASQYTRTLRSRFRAAVAAAVVIRLIGGCSTDEGNFFPGDAAPTEASETLSPDDASTERRPPYEPPDPPRPEDLPDGWELERTYDKSCSFYVPRSRDLLPPPLRWEECPDIVTPQGASCRFLAREPGVDSPNEPFAEAAWVAPNGSVVMAVIRSSKPVVKGAHFMMAEADGPVHSALFVPPIARCTPAFMSLFNGRYAMAIYEDSSSFGGGFLASDIDDLSPRLAVHLERQHTHAIYASPFFVIDLTKGDRIDSYSWDDASPLPLLWSSAHDHGFQQRSFSFANNAIFWSSSNTDYNKINIYTPSEGVRDFLSAGFVSNHGYGSLGTDGHDLVWLEGKGRAYGADRFETYDIMTAPYTTDPSQLAPRRLRSEEFPTLNLTKFIVGCGYAVQSTSRYLRLVRLSDGQSWKLEQIAGGTKDWEWSWSTPLALTCTELFARVSTRSEPRIHTVRLRLDSLGPGIDPD